MRNVSCFSMVALIVFLFGAVVTSSPVYSQDGGEQIDIEVVLTFEEKILRLKKALKEKEKEKKSLVRQFKTEQDSVIKEQLQQELTSASDVIVGLREEMINLSTGGARLYDEPPVVKREFNWRQDLELIFEPLLDQLREISERPRVVEKLESDIIFWEKRSAELSAAIENLKKNIDTVNNTLVKKDLISLLDTALARANTASQKLSLLRNESLSLEKQRNPIWSTLGEIFSTIILSIVFHFFIALFVAFLVYQAIRFLSFVPIFFIVKNNPGETVFAERAIVVVRIALGLTLAVMAYFVVLYSFTEWLLLVVSFLIIVGVALALKNALPEYFVEVKTMLNMGSIRQGERIIFQGLPWKITRLNVHTRLHNPALHGHLRVPLSEIVSASSRPYHNDEPWFPTKVGDIIFLEDDAFGRVSRQTPDIVEVDFGGAPYTYQTVDFLSRRPRNLSRQGFIVYEVFGFDYQHQNEITTVILALYKQGLAAAMKASPFAEHNTSLEVEFDNASASSLDLKVFAAFNGEAASDYFRIKRLLQKASVEMANKHGWVIPFQQLTVHHQPA